MSFFDGEPAMMLTDIDRHTGKKVVLVYPVTLLHCYTILVCNSMSPNDII